MKPETAQRSPSPGRGTAFWTVQGLSASRLVFALVFAVWVTRHQALDTTVAAALIALLLALELSDFLDGLLARRWKVVSPWGELFDPYVDSLARLMIYWSMAQEGWVAAWLPLLMAMRDVTVAYARLILSRSGASVAARWSGKLKAWVQGLGALAATVLAAILGILHGGGTSDIGFYSSALSWLVAAATLGSAIDYCAAAWRAQRDAA